MNAEGPGRTQDQDGEADSRPGQRSPSTEWGWFVIHFLESGLDSDRFIKAKPGTKRPVGQWDTHQPGDVDRDSLIKTGDGLLIIDIDDWRETPQSIRDLLMSTPTLTVQSPHAKGKEGHYYYLIEENIKTRNPDWGELRCVGALVVTPGTQLTDCKQGCCSPDSPGRYTIRKDRPIESIDVDDLPVNPTAEEPENNDEAPGAKREYPVDTGKPDFDWRDRLQTARRCNKKLDVLCEWAEEGGDPSDVGFPGDRSAAECALVTHLAFWFGRNKPAVRFVMNRLNPPKWSERGDDYRESVLKGIRVQQDVYTGSGESGPSRELVVDVWTRFFVAESMKTAEVADRVNRTPRQTRKALSYLQEKGIVEYGRDGRSGSWTLVDGESTQWLEEAADDLNSLMARERFLHDRNMRTFGKDSRPL